MTIANILLQSQSFRNGIKTFSFGDKNGSKYIPQTRKNIDDNIFFSSK
jgi:hypothetical protein